MFAGRELAREDLRRQRVGADDDRRQRDPPRIAGQRSGASRTSAIAAPNTAL